MSRLLRVCVIGAAIAAAGAAAVAGPLSGKPARHSPPAPATAAPEGTPSQQGASLQSADFVPLFNGRDLANWQGDPAVWSVKDGAITGRTIASAPLRRHAFLVWKGGDVLNFELRARVRLSG